MPRAETRKEAGRIPSNKTPPRCSGGGPSPVVLGNRHFPPRRRSAPSGTSPAADLADRNDGECVPDAIGTKRPRPGITRPADVERTRRQADVLHYVRQRVRDVEQPTARSSVG